jgi:hypothetical protein
VVRVFSKMGCGKCGRVMAKDKETKDMRRCAPFRLEVSGQRSLRADCSESVPSVPGLPRIAPGFQPTIGPAILVPEHLGPERPCGGCAGVAGGPALVKGCGLSSVIGNTPIAHRRLAYRQKRCSIAPFVTLHWS